MDSNKEDQNLDRGEEENLSSISSSPSDKQSSRRPSLQESIFKPYHFRGQSKILHQHPLLSMSSTLPIAPELYEHIRPRSMDGRFRQMQEKPKAEKPAFLDEKGSFKEKSKCARTVVRAQKRRGRLPGGQYITKELKLQEQQQQQPNVKGAKAKVDTNIKGVIRDVQNPCKPPVAVLLGPGEIISGSCNIQQEDQHMENVEIQTEGYCESQQQQPETEKQCNCKNPICTICNKSVPLTRPNSKSAKKQTKQDSSQTGCKGPVDLIKQILEPEASVEPGAKFREFFTPQQDPDPNSSIQLHLSTLLTNIPEISRNIKTISIEQIVNTTRMIHDDSSCVPIYSHSVYNFMPDMSRILDHSSYNKQGNQAETEIAIVADEFRALSVSPNLNTKPYQIIKNLLSKAKEPLAGADQDEEEMATLGLFYPLPLEHSPCFYAIDCPMKQILFNIKGSTLRVEDFMSVFVELWWTSTALDIVLQCPMYSDNPAKSTMSRYIVIDLHVVHVLLNAENIDKFNEGAKASGTFTEWIENGKGTPEFIFFPVLMSDSHYYCIKADVKKRKLAIFDPLQTMKKIEYYKSEGDGPPMLLDKNGLLIYNHLDLCLARIREYVEQFLQQKGEWCKYEDNVWPYNLDFQLMPSIPVQSDGYNCAPLIVLYVFETINFKMIPQHLLNKAMDKSSASNAEEAMYGIRDVLGSLILSVKAKLNPDTL